MLEHDVARLLDRDVEHDPRAEASDEAGEQALALLKRRSAKLAAAGSKAHSAPPVGRAGGRCAPHVNGSCKMTRN